MLLKKIEQNNPISSEKPILIPSLTYIVLFLIPIVIVWEKIFWQAPNDLEILFLAPPSHLCSLLFSQNWKEFQLWVVLLYYSVIPLPLALYLRSRKKAYLALQTVFILMHIILFFLELSRPLNLPAGFVH